MYSGCNTYLRCVESRLFLELLALSLLLAYSFTRVSEVVSSEQFPPHPAVYKANWACQNQNHYKAAKRIEES